MPERQDFVQRLLEEVRQFVAEAAGFRQAGRHEAALLTLLQAQERLFVRPVQDFMTRPVAEQVHLLALGETAAVARDKCLAYATLLTEAGQTYQAAGQAALAQGAYQLALHVTLLAALKSPSADSSEPRARIAALRERLPAGELSDEIAQLLNRLAAST